MKTPRFLSFFIALNLAFLFAKIYQHNTVVRLRYRAQHLERSAQQMAMAQRNLAAMLFQLKDQQAVLMAAREKHGLAPLSLSRITTLTSHVQHTDCT